MLRQAHSEHPSILTLAVARSVAVLAIDLLLETAALLAVFVAGLAFNRASKVQEEAWHEHMQDAVARFFDVPIFVSLVVFASVALLGVTATPLTKAFGRRSGQD